MRAHLSAEPDTKVRPAVAAPRDRGPLDRESASGLTPVHPVFPPSLGGPWGVGHPRPRLQTLTNDKDKQG